MAEIAQLYGNDAGRRLKREWRVEAHMGKKMKPVSPVGVVTYRAVLPWCCIVVPYCATLVLPW